MKELSEYLTEAMDKERFPINCGAYNIEDLITVCSEIRDPKNLKENDLDDLDQALGNPDWASDHPGEFAEFCKLCKKLKKAARFIREFNAGDVDSLLAYYEEVGLDEIGAKFGDYMCVCRTDGDDCAVMMIVDKKDKKLLQEFANSIVDTAGWDPELATLNIR